MIEKVEKVEYEGNTFALVVRHDYEADGVTFVTAPDNPLQLGVLNHSQGVEVRPHLHRNQSRTIGEVQEVLHIDYGEVEVRFYASDGRKLGSLVLKSGDTILLLSGGHGFNILKDSRIIEVKQGPYISSEEDKVFLEAKE